MLHVESPLEHDALQLHHVGIAVVRELHVQPVARLARLAVADVVGEDDEVAGSVERLPLAIEATGEAAPEELSARSSRPVQDEDRVVDRAAGVCGAGCLT